jgi:hypothetical protein
MEKETIVDHQFDRPATATAGEGRWRGALRRLQRLAEALAGVPPGRGGRWRRQGCFLCPPGEPSFDFDGLAQELAQGPSRREALRRLSLGLGTATLPLGVVALQHLAGLGALQHLAGLWGPAPRAPPLLPIRASLTGPLPPLFMMPWGGGARPRPEHPFPVADAAT